MWSDERLACLQVVKQLLTIGLSNTETVFAYDAYSSIGFGVNALSRIFAAACLEEVLYLLMHYLLDRLYMFIKSS